MNKTLNKIFNFNFFQFTVIFYLAIADGLNNPSYFTKMYSKHPMIRYLYTLFGAYNTFGSQFGMDLGFKVSIGVSVCMMFLLDVFPNRLHSEDELKNSEFVQIIDGGKESIGVVILMIALFFMPEKYYL